jgi:hypothetical protein
MKAIILLMSLVLSLLVAPLAAEAQPPTPVHRIGVLAGTTRAQDSFVEAFLEGMRALGYVEGQNLVLEECSLLDRASLHVRVEDGHHPAASGDQRGRSGSRRRRLSRARRVRVLTTYIGKPPLRDSAPSIFPPIVENRNCAEFCYGAVCNGLGRLRGYFHGENRAGARGHLAITHSCHKASNVTRADATSARGKSGAH